jgi:chondroitin AC lyase
MMNRIVKYALLCSCLLCGVLSVHATGTDELYRIKKNYKSILIPCAGGTDSLYNDFIRITPETEMSDQVVVELHQRYPFDLNKIENYLAKMKEDGSWSDINYLDTKRSGWEPKQHAERILELSKLYYSKQTKYYQSESIKRTIHQALNYWFSAKLKCLNWWYNQIGIPKTLGAAFILLEDQLSEVEKEAAIGVMENAQFGMTGQNKVWLAGNVLMRALLQNDANLVKAARDTIASEIVLGREEGIKNDWSFHQHGPQQQFGNYGLAYISGMSFFYRLFQGTTYEFDKQQMDILTSLINEGYRWIIWNRYMDISSLGRQFFHNAQIHKAYGLAFAAADLGLGDFPAHGNPLIGHKHFDDSDYTVHRSKDWMGTVKMSSNRVIGTELINEDNLKGYYLGDGATYFYVRGDEYLNVFPFWDWRKIPGVTAYEDDAPMPTTKGQNSNNRTDLVGGLSDGKCGMAAMEVNRDGLKAYKAWLFTDHFVVCLGTGIQSDSALCVTTSIDQRLKKGELEVWQSGAWKPITNRECFMQNDLRFFHDHTGYIVIGKDTLVAEAGKRTGRWCDFMKMYRPATVEGEVVSLYLRHGKEPSNASYQYIVFPASRKGRMESFNVEKEIRVICNDSVAQVLQVPSAGTGYWVAAYRNGDIKIDKTFFRVEAPGIYYVENAADGLKIKKEAPFRLTAK